jgi:hypothetical protein
MKTVPTVFLTKPLCVQRDGVAYDISLVRRPLLVGPLGPGKSASKTRLATHLQTDRRLGGAEQTIHDTKTKT